jgi:hypothetical protein
VRDCRKNGGFAYRVGYRADLERGEIIFTLLHNPIIAKLFKHNLILSSMLEVVRTTADFRSQHWILRSSRLAYSKGFKCGVIEEISLSDFIEEVESFDRTYSFIKDMFPKEKNTGKGGGSAPSAGNTFYLMLSNKLDILRSESNMKRLVDQSWPLFLCLYPIEAIEGRSASLARNMKVRGIPKKCEYFSIRMIAGSGISPLCRGAIHGAHIKPDSLGGSDRPENGLWLCEYHHSATEGKLSGKRDGVVIDVRLIRKA